MLYTKIPVTVVINLSVMICCVELLAQESPGFCEVPVPGELFCDDFSDGSATDGDPVSWSLLFGGTQAVEDGSLIITKPAPSFPASGAVPVTRSFTDISVRAQVRLLEGIAIGFGVRRDTRINRIYGGGIVNGMATIAIGGSNETLAEVPVDFDMQNEDVLLQFDVIGDSLKLWTWRADEARPTEPLLSAINDDISEGSFYIWSSADADDPNGTAQSSAFRFVQVATQSIPEPTSATLGLVGGVGALLCGRRRRLSVA